MDPAVMDLDVVRAVDHVGGIYQYINMVRPMVVFTGMHVQQLPKSVLIDMFPHVA
jgi:hypothetical protein